MRICSRLGEGTLVVVRLPSAGELKYYPPSRQAAAAGASGLAAAAGSRA